MSGKVTMGVLVAGFMLFANGASAQSTKTELVFAAPTGVPASYDPHIAIQNADTAPLSWMFNALVRFRPGQTNPKFLEPDLAESYAPNKTGTEWTFTIRKGVQCHRDYGEFTAEDAAYSVKRAMDPKRSIYSKDFEAVEDAVAVDRYTLKVILKHPIASLPGLLSNYHGGWMLCQKYAEEAGKNFSERPIGTGPFMFEKYEAQRYLRMVANEKYFKGAPKIKAIVYRYMPSQASRDLAYRSGEVDVEAGRNDDDWVIRAEAIPHSKVVALEPAQLININLNVTRPPLDDIRVRKAIAHAINRKELRAFVGERISQEAISVIPSNNIGVVKVDWPEYDPDKARKLLAEAGHPDGITLKMVQSNVPSNLRPMEVLQQQLAKVGIKMDMEVVDHTTWHSKIRQDLSDITFYAAMRFPVADFFLTQFFHSDSIVLKPTAITNFSHCTVADKEIEQARVEQDPAKRDALWAEAQRKIVENVCGLGLYQLANAVVWRDNLDLGYDMVGSFTLLPDITEKTRFTD